MVKTITCDALQHYAMGVKPSAWCLMASNHGNVLNYTAVKSAWSGSESRPPTSLMTSIHF